MTYDPASRCLCALFGQNAPWNTYINHTLTEVLGTPGIQGIAIEFDHVCDSRSVLLFYVDLSITLYTHTRESIHQKAGHIRLKHKEVDDL